jgi:hypothetical protein
VGKQRRRGEALLAAAALPAPPPPPPAAAAAAAPGPRLPRLPLDDPEFTRRLALLPQAEVSRHDAGPGAFPPTLTRVGCRAGRRGQRRVPAPGDPAKRWGFGLVDGREGWLDGAVAERRAAAPCGAQVRRAVDRSPARRRGAGVLRDHLGLHTVRRSKHLRARLAAGTGHLRLVSTPTDDPDSHRIEWLWRALRRAVTHNHQRATFAQVLADADAWAAALTPNEILLHLGSPFADDPEALLPPGEDETPCAA